MLSKFEKTYLKIGILLFITGPLQIIAFFELFIEQGPDMIFMHPVLSLMTWLIPAIVFHTIIFRLVVKDKNDREDITHTLGITRICLFAFQAGILMISRITFILIIRIISGNKEFRRDFPYILWLPEW